MRLVVLNKKFPELPKAGEFRPIAIISPLIKFILLRFQLKYEKFLKYSMSKT